jgi:hypothetical protein
MSKSPRIAKLEVLLERIRSRATAPRTAPAAPVAVVAAAPVAVAVAAPPPPPPPARPVMREVESRVEPAPAKPAPVAEVVEVDLLESTSVIDMTVEDVAIAESFESRERLVAAEPVPEEALADEAAVEEAVSEDVVIEAAVVAGPAEESPPDLLAAVEDVEEEAPLSSRRPVEPQPEQRLAEIAFGSEEPSPPRHTPPPESGRLPAAPELEFDGDITGVRDATPIAVVVEPVRTRELSAEATRVSLEPNDAVAEVVGAAQRFAPTTFAALLDASLAL